MLFAYTSVEPTLPTMVEQPTATNHQTHHLGVRGAIAPDSRLKEKERTGTALPRAALPCNAMPEYACSAGMALFKQSASYSRGKVP